MASLTSKANSLPIPDSLPKEIKASSKTGFYEDEGEFLNDAVKTLLAVRRDLRVAIACEFYKDGDISFGKAVEIARVDYEEMKRILTGKNIPIRRGAKTVEEMKSDAKSLSG